VEKVSSPFVKVSVAVSRSTAGVPVLLRVTTKFWVDPLRAALV
jgi:hypothetical protein